MKTYTKKIMTRIYSLVLVMAMSVMAFSSCTDMTESATYEFDQFLMYEDSVYYNGPFMVVDAQLYGENSIVVPYSSYESTSKSITIENAVLPPGVQLVSNHTIAAEAGIGSLNIKLTGTPTQVGSFNITFDLVCGDNRWFIRQNNVEVLAVVSPIGLNSVVLKGPVFDDERYYSDNYELTFSYTGATRGYTLELDTIEGYLKVDPDVYAKSDANGDLKFDLEESADGVWVTQTVALPDSFFDCTVDQDGNFTDSPASLGDLAVKFKYNELCIADSVYVDNPIDYDGFPQKDIEVDHFVSKGYRYKTITLSNGQTWFDRNLGATSIASQPVKMNGNSLDDTWVYNIATYGNYFVYYHNTGVSIMRDGNNPLQAQAYKVYIYDDNTTTTWNEVPVSDYCNIPYFKYGGAWEDNSYSETGNTGSKEDVYVALNNTATGGANNPCPSGYRVPTSDEVKEMITTVTGMTLTQIASANSTVMPALISKMNFGPSGFLYREGTTAIMNTSGGQSGMVGLLSNVQSAKGGAMVNRPSAGQLSIYTCDDLRDVTSSYCINPVHVSATGAVAENTYNNYSVARPPTAAVVRCIKHQE